MEAKFKVNQCLQTIIPVRLLKLFGVDFGGYSGRSILLLKMLLCFLLK